MSTDAAAHRATNARLCQWLGIRGIWRARSKETGQLSQSKFDSEEHANRMLRQFKSSEPYCVYPELATREHRETLENALMAKGYAFQAGGWTGHGSAAIFSGDMETTELLASTFDQTPQAALFAAAVALMEREKGTA